MAPRLDATSAAFHRVTAWVRHAQVIMVLVVMAGTSMASFARGPAAPGKPVRIIERVPCDGRPPRHLAFYTRLTGLEMIGREGLSDDGGHTWKPFRATPDDAAGLPHGYRREPFPAVIDPRTGRIVVVVNALDTPGLDPAIEEPPIAQNAFYLRYRVSNDAGRTYLFDEPIVEPGRTAEAPFDGVRVGTNGIYLGDVGSLPIFNTRGELLVPAQVCPLGPDGKPFNPTGAGTYTDLSILIGAWAENDQMNWRASQRVKGDPGRTTRGLIEPTLAVVTGGRILMVMRGSNEGRPDLPTVKWRSVSDDHGQTWTPPQPWTFADGKPFFSPSSMSQLFTHSSGRIFWIGNISPTNGNGNDPRWPLVIGEVDQETLGLVESSLVTIDTRRPDDPPQLDISHFRAEEDRATGEIILVVPRALNAYQTYHWGVYRLAVE